MARQGSQIASIGRNRRLWTLVAVIAATVVILAAFASRRREIAVHAMRASRATIMAAIDTDGRVEPLNNFEAHAPAPAIVKKVFAHWAKKIAAMVRSPLEKKQAKKIGRRYQQRYYEAGRSV